MSADRLESMQRDGVTAVRGALHWIVVLVALLCVPGISGCCKRNDGPSSTGGTVGAKATIKPAVRYDLVSSSARHLLSSKYPTTDLRIELAVRYTNPGTVLDTVGILAAPVGSFAISVLPSGLVQAQIYDPGRASTVRISNGWHVMTSQQPIGRGATSSIVLELWKGEVALWVNDKLASRIALATPLSGAPVYVGDFPGDDGMGARYNTHPGMTGSVHVAYFGVLDPKVYVADRDLKVTR